MYGAQEFGNQLVCGECNKTIDGYDCNFCSYCGNPLSETAINLHKERMKSFTLDALGAISKNMYDKDVLNAIINTIETLNIDF